jgi:integrase
MAGRDLRTRTQGVYARHTTACPVTPEGKGCRCTPSFYGRVYDRGTKKQAVTGRFPTVAAAASARRDLLSKVERGETTQHAGLRLNDACERFEQAMRDGRALTKHGNRYRATAIDDIVSCFRTHILTSDIARKRITDIRRGHVQQLVDDLTPRLSGSRVRSVVNAIRSLYTWAIDRDLALVDPAARIKLPAMNATPRDRVATPLEMHTLLERLQSPASVADALPYALAVYAMGRRADIQRLTWAQVDLDLGLVGWQDGKTRAAQRVIPAVRPLRALLKRAHMLQGQPAADALVCPPLNRSASGLLETGSLDKRARKAWGWTLLPDRKTWIRGDHALEPIGLHECRHTAATWLDHAGISPKIASVLMGHETPERQAGAAHITLARYTHVLPDEYEKARDALDRWLAAETTRERDARTASA